MSDTKMFKDDLLDLCHKAHAMACSKGFYDTPKSLTENIVLIAGEIGEMVEAHRRGDAESSKIPGIGESEEEAADVVIRIMDTVGYLLAKEGLRPTGSSDRGIDSQFVGQYVNSVEEKDFGGEYIFDADVWEIGWDSIIGLAKSTYWSIGCALTNSHFVDHFLESEQDDSWVQEIGYNLAHIIAAIEGHFPNIRLAVEAKMQYNSGRPRLHGKKY